MTDTIRVGIIGTNSNCDWSKPAHLPGLLGMPPMVRLACFGWEMFEVMVPDGSYGHELESQKLTKQLNR